MKTQIAPIIPASRSPIKKLLFVLTFIFAAASIAHAELISTEEFDTYTVGDSIAGSNGGTGWSTAWTLSTSLKATIISNDPITYTSGTATYGGGNALKIASDSTSTTNNIYNAIVRKNTGDWKGRDVFFRCIVKIKNTEVDDGTEFASNIFCFWEADCELSGANGAGVAVGASGQLQARVRGQNEIIKNEFDANRSLKFGETYLVVTKYTGWDAEKGMYRTVQVWLNPTFADENSTDAQITVTKNYTGTDTTSTDFQGLRLRAYGLMPTRYHIYDAFRIASTWEDVMSADAPPPAPPPDPENFTVAEESEGWERLSHSLDIAPGGVFDFAQQGLADGEAGAHGFIRATAGGHFEFENRPGVPVRFWGVNLCYDAIYLTKEQADTLAERLARSGYNTVRIHHFDGYLVQASLDAGGDSHTFTPDRLDQLDYLFHALKKRGIYINIDLYSDRRFSQAEADAFGVPIGETRNCFKGLVPINTAALDAWKQFATKLLAHINPYTNLAWGRDPALIGICPVNEDPLWRHYNNDGILLPRYRAKFEELNPAYAGTNWSAANTARDYAWNKFIYDTNAQADAVLMSFLKNDLGIKALITGANYTIAQGLTFVRQHYDYVDNHQYSDHPSQLSLPITFSQGSEVSTRAFMPARMMPSRIFGKPFVTTEYHFCRPNRNRYEGVLLMPAYASLQDWDALYNFHYATSTASVTNGSADNYFSVANDPISLVGDRLGAFIFLRGDIKPATTDIAYTVREAEAYSGDIGKEFEGNFRAVGLVTRIGSLPGEPAAILASNPSFKAAVVGDSMTLPAKTYRSTSTILTDLKNAGVIPADSTSADNRRLTSETGEIELDATDRTMRVVTPRGEHFLLSPASQLTGDRVSITNGAIHGAISVVAIKNADEIAASSPMPTLANAKRILVTHLTDALTKGMTFQDTDRKVLKNWGTLPHLVRNGSATLTLTLPPGDWSAWKTDITGARTTAHTLTRVGESNNWTMTVSTGGDAQAGAQFAYELVRAYAPPVITNISKTTAAIGESITITGANFSGATITIGGNTVTPTAITDTTITITLPATAIGINLPVAITTEGVTVTAAQTLTVTAVHVPAPVITGLSAATAHPSDIITITGANLDNATISVGGVIVTPVTNTATMITFIVPVGTTGGIIHVSTLGGVTSAAQHFAIVPNSGEPGVLQAPAGIVALSGSEALLYVSDTTLHTIQLIASGTIRTLAGQAGTSGKNNGSGTDAQFNKPRGLAINHAGCLVVADSGNNLLRSINAEGIVTTTTTGLGKTFSSLAGVAAHDSPGGETYIADTANNTIKKITAAGDVLTVAGAAASGTANGALLAARFASPAGIAVDVTGNYLYVADTGNHVIRLIDLASGTVSTFAGQMKTQGNADGPALATAQFNAPGDLLVDGDGDVYVADTGNSRIRRIAADGARTVETLAGGEPGFVDGTGTLARFLHPAALTMTEDGSLYVADTGNAAIRRIAPDYDATVSTLQLQPGPKISTGKVPPEPWDQRRGSGGGGAPTIWLLITIAALAALRMRNK